MLNIKNVKKCDYKKPSFADLEEKFEKNFKKYNKNSIDKSLMKLNDKSFMNKSFLNEDKSN